MAKTGGAAAAPFNRGASGGITGVMHLTPDELLARLRDLGIDATTHEHAPVHTVAEAKAETGHLPGGHCKNLFLKDHKGQLWLVVALEDAPVDLKALGPAIGSGRLSFGKPELLREVLGVEPGSVTPFALANDRERRVRPVLQATLMREELLNFHPLVNSRTTAIRPADLERFLAACGHEARIVELPAPGDLPSAGAAHMSNA